MVCQRCQKEKPDAEPILDPYARAINDEKVVMILCNDCYQERVDSI